MNVPNDVIQSVRDSMERPTDSKRHVFISWSGERSRIVAEALREWLPMVLQTLDVWMSESDTEKGANWDQEVAEHLRRADEGIVCLMPENLRAPWLLFEAGAISNQVDRACVCTYLCELRPSNVPRPLGRFQHTMAEKADTLKLLRSLNQRTGKPLEREQLDKLFDAMWPSLERKLQAIPKPTEPIEAERPVREMIDEVLDLIRSRSATDDSSAIMAKLQHMELALFLLSFQTIGKPLFDTIAFDVLAAGRRTNRSATPGEQGLDKLWTIFEEIVKKKNIGSNIKDATPSAVANEISTKAPSTPEKA